MKAGTLPTGVIVNAIRIAIALVSIGALVLATIIAGLTAFDSAPLSISRMYVPIGLFVAAFVLLLLAASFKVQSHPYLLPNVVYQAMEDKKPSAEIESMIKTLEAHSGTAGFFNRIGFSGLSLGTIASAFLILLLGLISLKFDAISSVQFDAFMDLAKLLFGAFIGSFASRPAVASKPAKDSS